MEELCYLKSIDYVTRLFDNIQWKLTLARDEPNYVQSAEYYANGTEYWLPWNVMGKIEHFVHFSSLPIAACLDNELRNG